MTEAASYLTVERGTAVADRLGSPVGSLERVLCHGDGRFDGLLVRTPRGLRFVDAPEVRNVSGSEITLAVTRAEVENGDPRRPNAPTLRRRRLLRPARRQRVPVARWGRTSPFDDEREAVVDRLKRAYVDDRLTTEALAELVARAHEARTLRVLEGVLDRAGL